LHDLSVFKDKIFIENTLTSISEDIDDWAGLCFDVSHHESRRLDGSLLFDEVTQLLKTKTIGCCHLNVIREEPFIYKGANCYDYHYFFNLKEFDYCVKYKKHLPEIIALELENSLGEQLEAKKYLEKLLGI